MNSLRTKLILMGVSGIVVMAIVLALISFYTKSRMVGVTSKAIDQQAKNETARIAEGTYKTIATQDKLLRIKLRGDLNVALDQLEKNGPLSLAKETIAWKATNQFNKENKEISLPKFFAGKTWLGQNADTEAVSPVVDEAKKLVGGTCTVFQRMNEDGDMLRISTNIVAKDGKRAIGTYIPATNPDGKTNPVIAAVKKGEEYVGRAFVVNDWYLAAYRPLNDAQGNLVGMLYVGLPIESVKELREEIAKTIVGKTGYVFVLGGSGEQKGHYIISQNNKRNGENIFEAKDADGKLFIQSMISKALVTRDGQCDFEMYPWKNSEDPAPRLKVTAVAYYEPWDWVIGAGAYQDDFDLVKSEILGALGTSIMLQIILVLLIGFIAAIISFLVARSISRAVLDMNFRLKEISEGDGDLTQRLEINRSDELGEMAERFNTFIGKIQLMVKDIGKEITSLVSNSTQLSKVAGKLATSADDSANKANAVASAAEEMSATLSSISGGMQETTGMITNVAAATEEMTATVDDIAKNSEKARLITGDAVSQAEQISKLIQQLGEAAQEIGKVTEAITNISSQTNLLALNATIEAARAGAAGKGFAVVANEIKELAQQTARATEDIKGKIQDIQHATKSTITDIGKIGTVISDVSEIVGTIAAAIEEQSIVTRDIAGNIAHATNAVQETNDRVSESSSVSHMIAEEIADVNNAASEITRGSGQVEGSSKDLSKLAETLKAMVERFKV